MTIPTLEQYLQIFCNYQQDNWYTLLLLAEFAYNNTLSTTTGISPFFANKGYHPNLTIHPEWDLASSWARDLVVNLDELHQELKSTISKAQLQYQGPTDAKRSPAPNFTIGEQAFIKAKFFHTTRPSHKLSNKFLGPFEILAKASTHSFTLQLPDTFWGVHPVFHVSMLEPTFPNEIPNCVQSPPPPVCYNFPSSIFAIFYCCSFLLSFEIQVIVLFLLSVEPQGGTDNCYVLPFLDISYIYKDR